MRTVILKTVPSPKFDGGGGEGAGCGVVVNPVVQLSRTSIINDGPIFEAPFPSIRMISYFFPDHTVEEND